MAVGLGLDSVDDETAHDCEDLKSLFLCCWEPGRAGLAHGSCLGLLFLSYLFVFGFVLRVDERMYVRAMDGLGLAF